MPSIAKPRSIGKLINNEITSIETKMSELPISFCLKEIYKSNRLHDQSSEEGFQIQYYFV